MPDQEIQQEIQQGRHQVGHQERHQRRHPRSITQTLPHWLALAAWAGLIFFLSSQPASTFPVLPQGSDKVVHALEFGVFSLLLYRALIFGGPSLPARSALWLSILLSVLFGVSDEVHQAFEASQTRVASVADVLADAFGALVATFAYHHYRLRHSRTKPPEQERA